MIPNRFYGLQVQKLETIPDPSPNSLYKTLIAPSPNNLERISHLPRMTFPILME